MAKPELQHNRRQRRSVLSQHRGSIIRNLFVVFLTVGAAAALSAGEDATNHESYFSREYQKTVNRKALEQTVEESLRKAEKALPELRTFVNNTVAGNYLFADCLTKRLEIFERLCQYVKKEKNRKEQPEGLLYASHGAWDIINTLEYFDLEQKRFPVNTMEKPKIFHAKEFGIKGDNRTDCTAPFQKAFDAIRKLDGKPAVLKIPRGKYRFDTLNPKGLKVRTLMPHQRNANNIYRQPHLLLLNLSNVTVDCEPGTEFLFTHSTAVDGIAVYGGDNITFKNIKLDFVNNPFTQCTIKSVDKKNNRLVLSVEKGFPPLIGPSYFIKTPTTILWAEDGSRFLTSLFGPSKLEKAENGNYYFYFSRQGRSIPTYLKLFKPGRRLTLASRYNGMSNAALFYRSRFVTLCNVECYNSPCGGFADVYGYAANFINCSIIPHPGRNSLCSTNADGIASINCKIGPYLKNCKLDRVTDDAFTTYDKIAGFIEQVSSGGTELLYSSHFLHSGAHVAVIDVISGKINAEFVVKKASGKRITFAPALPGDVKSQENLYKDHMTDDDVLLYFRPDSKKYNFANALLNFDWDNSLAIISGCSFSSNLGDAVHLESPNAIIENNIIDYSTWFGINVSGRNLNYEPFVPYNVVARDNRISNCTVPIFSAFGYETLKLKFPAMRFLKFENNVCSGTRSPRPPEFRNIGGLVYKNNQTIGSRTPVIESSEDVTMDGEKNK